MFRARSGESESNFWISYADLMAGLLFVFILLIGAIVSKSILIREDLTKTSASLNMASERIMTQEQNLTLKSDEIAKLRVLIASIKLDKETLSKKLNAINSELKKTRADLNQTVVALNDSNHSLSIATKKNNSLAGDILKLTQEVADAKKNIELKESEADKSNIKISELFAVIEKDKSKYEDVLSKLRSQKAKIKSLTGINLKVIERLKKNLGEKIDIDKNSGALRLSSNILFDKGSAVLRPDANASIKKSFDGYITALLGDNEIKPHLDKIIIEGHTDSDGSYMYNMRLSQERALAVMSYLSTLPVTKKYGLKKYLVASGRGYEDIIKKKGVEDKDASRRIEIKFDLKNQDAMQEIEKILDYDKQ